MSPPTTFGKGGGEIKQILISFHLKIFFLNEIFYLRPLRRPYYTRERERERERERVFRICG